MAKIPESYSYGDNEETTIEDIKDIVKDIYKDLAVAINKKPDIYFRSSNGLPSDTLLSIGDININSNTGKVETLVAHPTQTTVTWTGNSTGIGLVAYALVSQTGVLLNGLNLTSSLVSVGYYKLSFTTPMLNTNYVVVATPQNSDVLSVVSITVGVKTMSYFTIKIKFLSNVFFSPETFSVMVTN